MRGRDGPGRGDAHEIRRGRGGVAAAKAQGQPGVPERGRVRVPGARCETVAAGAADRGREEDGQGLPYGAQVRRDGGRGRPRASDQAGDRHGVRDQRAAVRRAAQGAPGC